MLVIFFRHMDLRVVGYSYLNSPIHFPNIPLVVYSYDTLTWCVQHARSIPKWENIFHMVEEREVIAYVLITYALVAICFYFLSSLNHLEYDIYTIFLKCLLAVTNAAPNWNMPKTTTRITIAFGLWCGILTHTIMIHFYIIFLNKTLYGYQISTQFELIDAKFKLAGSNSTLQMVKDSRRFPISMLDEFRICPNLDDCLEELSYDNRLAVAVSHMHAMNSHRVSSEMIYCFNDGEHIIEYPVSAMMSSDHPFFESVHRMAQLAFERGLFVKWLKDSSGRPRHMRPRRNHELQIQTIDHIMFAVMIYFLVISSAIITFVLEHVIFYKLQRDENRYWRWADMIIDGKRHFQLPRMKQRHRIRYE